MFIYGCENLICEYNFSFVDEGCKVLKVIVEIIAIFNPITWDQVK